MSAGDAITRRAETIDEKLRLAKIEIERAAAALQRAVAAIDGALAQGPVSADETPARLVLKSESPYDPIRGQVDVVFKHYCWKMNRSHGYKLTGTRAQKIRARLRDGFTVDQLKTAVDNMALSAFHMGKNEAKRRYNDLVDNLCKTYEQTEAWVAGRPVEGKINEVQARRRRDEQERAADMKRRREAAVPGVGFGGMADAFKRALKGKR